MVFLNENISFNVKTLKQSFSFELKKVIDECDHFLSKKNVTFIQDIIEKKIRSLFNNDHFLNINMNPNLCSFKHKRGKDNGFFCCKKIKKNKQDGSYMCCKHNKNNIPKKRKNIIKQNHVHDSLEKENKDLSLKIKKTNVELLGFAPPKTNNSNIQNENNKCSTPLNNNEKYQKISDISNNKKINHVVLKNYKNRFILNADGLYTKLIKEVPLLDFCINKLKSKYKKNYYNSFLYLNNIKVNSVLKR